MSFIGGMSPNGQFSAARSSQYTLRPGADLLYYNTPIDPSQRVFGEPGASLYHANLDDVNALEAGIKGEQRVGYELERLAAQYPNTYVFHSVKLPGKIGDMDHIVVQENRALLVDTKNWRRSGVYTLNEIGDDYDVVLRDGYPFDGGEIHLRRQLVDWQLNFISSDVNMFASLVIANEAPVNQNVDPGYDITNINGLAKIFSVVFKADTVTELNTDMLRYYANLVQNPNFNPNDASNYVETASQTLASEPAPVYHQAPVTPRLKATTLSKWLVFWSVMNYIVLFLMFPIAGLSAIPLIITAHRHRHTVKKKGLGGKGLLTATLFFSYLLFLVWTLFIAFVAMYYFVLPYQV
jgi:hypothetical protein